MRWKEASDTAAVEGMARGDPEALACLYDRYAQLMVTVAVRMLHERAAAEDLVHDVFMEAWRSAARYRPDRACVRTWLLIRLRSRALDQLRSRSVRRDAKSRIASEQRAQGSAGLTAETSPDRAAVLKAMSTLPDKQRQVLELGYFSGMSSTEIAQVMGSPVGTVKSRTAAALSRLRVALDAVEGES